MFWLAPALSRGGIARSITAESSDSAARAANEMDGSQASRTVSASATWLDKCGGEVIYAEVIHPSMLCCRREHFTFTMTTVVSIHRRAPVNGH